MRSQDSEETRKQGDAQDRRFEAAHPHELWQSVGLGIARHASGEALNQDLNQNGFGFFRKYRRQDLEDNLSEFHDILSEP